MNKYIEQNTSNFKFVVVVNKEIENMGTALNAVAHMFAGLVNRASETSKTQMSFIDFNDKTGQTHESISALSLIVLRGRNTDIAKLKREALEKDLLHVDFLESMTGDTYLQQLERTALLDEGSLKYYGISLFADKETLNALTKKLSLWK